MGTVKTLQAKSGLNKSIVLMVFEGLFAPYDRNSKVPVSSRGELLRSKGRVRSHPRDCAAHGGLNEAHLPPFKQFQYSRR